MKAPVLMVIAILTGAASYMAAIPQPALELTRNDILYPAVNRDNDTPELGIYCRLDLGPSVGDESLDDLPEPDSGDTLDPCEAPQTAPTLITQVTGPKSA